MDMIPPSDLYLFAVKDDAYQKIIASFEKTTAICVHTSGCLDMNILATLSENFGVLYPFQTFSKGKDIDFQNIPFCIEASNSQIGDILFDMAKCLSPKVHFVSTEQRAYLHLAGVFANNFSNAMFTIAQLILQQREIDFDIAMPLIEETVEKLDIVFPADAQTGPAVRNDENIINKHLSMIKDKDLKELYQLITKIIQKNTLIL
jgi:predicted short-subunit dehydrogenase-like oxidoreductase (DUF2520 family)